MFPTEVSARETKYPRPFRLRSRSSLIAAMVILQAGVIGLGWWATVSIAQLGLASRMHERVVDEASRAVTHLSLALSELPEGPLDPGSPAWASAQKLVEDFRLPGSTSVAIVAKNGEVLCHSEGRAAGTALSHQCVESITVTLLPGREPIALADLNPGTVVTGESTIFGAPATIAVLANARTQSKIIAYQPIAALAAAESRFARLTLLWCSAGGVILLGITVLGSVALVRRYDTILTRLVDRLEAEVDRRTRRGLSIRNGLIFGLAKLADYRDTDTGKHLERICRYCELLSLELLGSHHEIDRAWIERLKLAASMHDIGKVGIPDAILLKPGRLTPEERRQMETHTTIGADTLIAIRQRVGDDDLLNMSIQVALCHHEKYDGSGYPSRISGEQIPLCARIVALADMYDALTSKRVYKEAMTHEQARQIIAENRGSHFDPMIADAFERRQAQFDSVRAQLQPGDGETEIPVLALAVQQADGARRLAA
ncbi:MAG: HD domain-containing protein [Planctomycetes bacterium]|nr:HD domain-containing protein [Planctomycetota bacterium]